MKHYITPEEHARMQRRRGRQALGLLVAIMQSWAVCWLVMRTRKHKRTALGKILPTIE